jgi:origin recognition complex subunit 3
LAGNIEFVDDIMTFEELGVFLKSHGCHVAMLSSMEFSLKNGIAGCLKALLREFLGGSFDVGAFSINLLCIIIKLIPSTATVSFTFSFSLCCC